MKATGEDALNLIRYWKNEGSQLRCTCTSEGVGLSVTGKVAELSGLGAVNHGDGVRGPHHP